MKFKFLLIMSLCVLPLGNLAAIEPGTDYFHITIKPDKGLPQTTDIPASDYDSSNDLVVFSNDAYKIEVSGLNGEELNFDLTAKNRPYGGSLKLNDKRIQVVETDEGFTVKFLADFILSGRTMNVPVSYTVVKGSYIVFNY